MQHKAHRKVARPWVLSPLINNNVAQGPQEGRQAVSPLLTNSNNNVAQDSEEVARLLVLYLLTVIIM